jgi:NADP oxidoreductase coenzyme F420-dependent
MARPRPARRIHHAGRHPWLGQCRQTLAGSFPRAGHDVTPTASNPNNARAAASQTGAQAADSNQQAIADTDVVVLAVQYPAVDAVLTKAGHALDGKVLIDTTNRVNPADPGSVLDGNLGGRAHPGPRPRRQGGQGLQHRLRLARNGPGSASSV